MIENGACVNEKDADLDLQTPLHFSIGSNQIETSKILLLHGADIDAKSMFIETPLHRATINKFVEAMLLALKNGASMTIRNDKMNTPIESAIDQKGIEAMKTFLSFEHFK